MTLSQIRSQLEAIKREYAHVIAAAVLKPVASKVVNLWDIATAKKQPKPSPILCVRKVVDAGFRRQTLKALHIYLEDCRRYGGFPNAEEITEKLFPPGKRVNLSDVLPYRFPVR